jgi:hypothetical protein
VRIFNGTQQALSLEFFDKYQEEPFCVVSLLPNNGVDDVPNDADYIKIEHQ